MIKVPFGGGFKALATSILSISAVPARAEIDAESTLVVNRAVKSMCYRPPVAGRRVSNSVAADITLSSVIKKIVGWGATVKTARETEDYRGVTNNQLAQSLFNYNHCVETVTKILVEHYRIIKAANVASSRASVQAAKNVYPNHYMSRLIFLRNNYQKTIHAAVRFIDETGELKTFGWYNIQSRAGFFPSHNGMNLRASSSVISVYAYADDGSDWVGKDSSNVRIVEEFKGRYPEWNKLHPKPDQRGNYTLIFYR